MDTLNCTGCGIHFGMPDGYLDNRRSDKKNFYCPNGHSMSYTESEADCLRRERNRLKQQVAQRDDAIREYIEQRDAAERTASAYKGQVTRLKNRSKAGLCPCCNRHFTNLERHMASKHPNMDPAEPLQVIEGGKNRPNR